MLLALASGCSQSPRLDSSTPASIEASIEQVQSALPPEKRDQFSTALSTVIANALGGGYRDVGDTPEGRERVRAALDGKSADEIIAAAEKIRGAAAGGQAAGS